MGRPRRKSRRETELVAVVDLGSTAVRFLLARIKPSSGAEVLEGFKIAPAGRGELQGKALVVGHQHAMIG